MSAELRDDMRELLAQAEKLLIEGRPEELDGLWEDGAQMARRGAVLNDWGRRIFSEEERKLDPDTEELLATAERFVDEEELRLGLQRKH